MKIELARIDQDISGVWIMDANSGITLIEQQYVKRGLEEETLIGNFLSAILSFGQVTLSEQKIDKIIFKDQKIIYEISNTIVFVAIAARNFETYMVKKILSHIRANFYKTYPAVASENWQFDQNVTVFMPFSSQIDSIIQQYCSNVLLMNLAVIGLENVGKTTLTYSYAQKRKNREYLPTRGMDIVRFRYWFRNREFSICLWDLGGQEAYRELWPRFASEATGLLYVVDSTSKRWNEDKITFKEIISIFDIPYVVIANKQDILVKAKEPEFISSRLGISEELVFPASALLDEGIYSPLEYILKQMSEREESPEGITKTEIASPYIIQRIHDLGLTFLRKRAEDSSGALQEIIAELRKTMGFDLVVLNELNHVQNTFEPVVIDGYDVEEIRSEIPSTPYGEGLVSVALQRREVLILGESGLEPSKIKIPILEQYHTEIVVPLFMRDTEWGALTLFASERDRGTKELVSLVEKFCQYLELGL